MLVLKSCAAALLAAMVLAVIGPPLVIQDAGPGKPDDVAQVLPQDTVAFVEIVKLPKLLNDWKDYIGAVTTPAGKDKVCEFIENWLKQTLEIVPEKLLKDLKEGLPTLQRVAVALTAMPGDEFPWVFIATSSDPAFFKKLQDDLAVFATEEKAHGDVKVLAIKKMGDLKWDHPMYFAAAGNRLVVTTSWTNLADALDRAAGKGSGGDLRKNPLYAKLAPAPSDDPAIRAFSSWDFDAISQGPRGRYDMPRRYTSVYMDQADAVFGFRRIGGAIVESTFKPGRVVSTLRVPVNSPCRIYDAVRQPAGSKELLARLPKKTLGFVHQNLKGGKEVWTDVEDFIRRYQESERKLRPDREGKDYVDQMNEASMEEIGVLPRDIAAAVGTELLFAAVEPGDEPGLESMFACVVKTTDPKKALEIMEAISKKSGNFTTETEDKTTIFKHDGHVPICFGIRESVAGIAANEALLKEMLNAKEDASGISKKLPKDADTVATVGAVNPTRLIDTIFHFMGEEKPDPLTHMKPDDWVVFTVRTDKDQAVMTITDGGYGAILETGLATFPMWFLGMMRVSFRMAGVYDTVGVSGEKPKPEPPALAADELAKRVAEYVPLLRSEDLPVRDKALADLKALGKQAVPQLVEAFKKEKDAESRARLSRLLLDYNAWDALPELLDAKVDAFLDEFRTAVEATDDQGYREGYVSWYSPDSNEPWSMEPSVQDYYLRSFKNSDVLKIPKGLSKLVERVSKADLGVKSKVQFAGLFAYNNCADAHPLLLKMRDAENDAATRGLLTIALSWSEDAKAKDSVYRSLEAKDLATRRGAFIAAERSKDPEIVTRLFDRTKDADFESRWNAGFTLRKLTDGKMDLNAFLPETEFEAQVQAAKKWWEANKGTFKLHVEGK